MKRHPWFFIWPTVAGMKDGLPDWEMNQPHIIHSSIQFTNTDRAVREPGGQDEQVATYLSPAHKGTQSPSPIWKSPCTEQVLSKDLDRAAWGL